jgi:hypothetical protein
MGWGTLLNIGATLWGASETSKANSISAAMQAEQMAIQKEMLEMARLREDYDTELRDDQKKQIDEYQATLQEVFNRLGAREQVSEQSIRGDAEVFYDQNMYDLNQSIDRVNSQGYAGQASRGMLDSSVENDRKRELTGKYSNLMSKARTDAQDRAFDKASQYETLIDTNRSNITGEYDDYYSKPFDMMNVARKSDGAGALNSAATVTGNMADNAAGRASDTATAFGRELEQLRENDWDFSKYTSKKDK